MSKNLASVASVLLIAGHYKQGVWKEVSWNFEVEETSEQSEEAAPGLATIGDFKHI